MICLAMAIGLAFGLGPMIAVQAAFYAELFGANVRYTGFAARASSAPRSSGSRRRSRGAARLGRRRAVARRRAG